jgi:N-acetylneuraminic acid mutarotase
MSGSSTGDASGVYGTLGAASTTNVPGARAGAASWIDESSNLWLFGGEAYDSTGAWGIVNDLWEFNPTEKTWTWVSGRDTANTSAVSGTPGIYGTLGVASVNNLPGARLDSASWRDSSGNLWLFGGGGYDSAGTNGSLNDLWEYSPATKEWTLFGGNGLDSVTSGVGAAVGCLNDLWEFSPTAKTWTWVSGSNLENTAGIYGTLGVVATSNTPGCRESAVSWTDISGNLWLFGGTGYDSTGTLGELNDLWKFSPTIKEWTWVGGSNKGDAGGVYGIIGVASANNAPGGRASAAGWTDTSGNLWLFGGAGFDSTGTIKGDGVLNDLWRYQP